MEIKIATVGDKGTQWANTGWRNCAECGGAFWDSNDNATICCDKKLTLNERGQIVWAKK